MTVTNVLRISEKVHGAKEIIVVAVEQAVLAIKPAMQKTRLR